MQPDLTIRPTPPVQWEDALRLAIRSLGSNSSILTSRLIAAAKADPGRLDGLLQARRGDQLVGAVLAEFQAGRTVSVWVPEVLDSSDPAVSLGLLQAVVQVAQGKQVRLAQALLPDDAGRTAELFRQAQFDHLADLLYLVGPQAQFPTVRPPLELQIETYHADAEERWARVIEQTYNQSLDCPGLNGIRDAYDVLEGYRDVGNFDPTHWLLFRYQGRDVGCVLLNEYAGGEEWEIVYLGLIPEARGRGWGLSMTRYAQWLAGCAGVLRLFLAVDAANEPALQMYGSAGFLEWDRRAVFTRVINPGDIVPEFVAHA